RSRLHGTLWLHSRRSVPRPAPRRSGRLWRLAHSRRSCPHYAHIFRTSEVQENQEDVFCAKIVICAPTGEGDIVNLYGSRQPPPIVGATKKRRLLAVACQRRIS